MGDKVQVDAYWVATIIGAEINGENWDYGPNLVDSLSPAGKQKVFEVLKNEDIVSRREAKEYLGI
jgi:hypothetical protein